MQPILDAIVQGRLEREEANRWLTVVLEGLVDHYAEYRDYNSTTTQSDRGEMLYMLLDFLRLRVRYDRVSWNLKPIFWAHEVLVRGGCHQTAQQWRGALAERVGREADQYLVQLTKLQEKYAMKMPTVADRLGERFLIPMTIDRMRALVRPAMKQLRTENGMKHSPAFDLLVKEAHAMTREPTGVGLDIQLGWSLSKRKSIGYSMGNVLPTSLVMNRPFRCSQSPLRKSKPSSPLPPNAIACDRCPRNKLCSVIRMRSV